MGGDRVASSWSEHRTPAVILAISTSSPVVSVALLGPGGSIAEREASAPRNASEWVVRFTDELLSLAKADLTGCRTIVVDTGPGSFTGVKVGVTMAKIWAELAGAELRAISSFDLIDPAAIVALPLRTGMWLLRHPGREAEVVDELPSGLVPAYGRDGGRCPRAASAFHRLEFSHVAGALDLVPAYVAEPNISVPKVAFRKAPATDSGP